VLLELTNVERYVWRGVLYTKGVIYSATPDEAERFLTHEEEGKTYFKRYTKKAERPKVDEIPTVDLPTPKTVSATTGTVTPTKIEIGSPEELADLNLPAEDGPVTDV
jgi:hypothetical protein